MSDGYDDYDRDRDIITVDSRGDLYARISVTEEHSKELLEEAEERGVSRSGMMRKWMAIGRNVEEQIDPRALFHSTQGSVGGEPIKRFILDQAPSSEEDAVDVEEFEEQLQEAILDRFRELLYSNEAELEKTESREVYVRD